MCTAPTRRSSTFSPAPVSRGRTARRTRSAPATPPAAEPQWTHPLRRGHVGARPPATRVPHSFRAGDSPLTFLAYGTREPNDIAWYPRSNKISFRGIGLMARLEALEYSDG